MTFFQYLGMFYIKCCELDKTCIDICMLMGNSVDIYELIIWGSINKFL